jgi:excisionase family DNA binding protein
MTATTCVHRVNRSLRGARNEFHSGATRRPDDLWREFHDAQGGKTRLPHDIMTFDELAEFLRMHPSMRLHSSTIFRLLRMGKLRAFRVGSEWRFSRDSVERLVHLDSDE